MATLNLSKKVRVIGINAYDLDMVQILVKTDYKDKTEIFEVNLELHGTEYVIESVYSDGAKQSRTVIGMMNRKLHNEKYKTELMSAILYNHNLRRNLPKA